jgi:hypothetical protein
LGVSKSVVIGSCALNDNAYSGDQLVAIGPNVCLPNFNGSCQLVIGYAAGSNWLTGNCTLAIKPGGGIIDCAGSCGTAGQVLLSNGANAICWGSVPATAAATPSVLGTVYGKTSFANTLLGQFAGSLIQNANGCTITAVGYCAGSVLATPSNGVTALGAGTLSASTCSQFITALGDRAMCSAGSTVENVAVGTLALSSVTGCCNTTLGSLSGYSLTSGNSNVFIGSNVVCANTSGDRNVVIGADVTTSSLTSSCELAIGYNTGCNWITGNSTLAIEPGAGIIDCAGLCGTACQALLSTGTNAVVWGSVGIPSWTNGGTVTSKITGTTTNPSPGNVGYNTIYYRQIGTKEYEVVYRFNQSAPGSAGSGDYLFTLPASLQFDTTLQFQAAISFAGPNTDWWTWALPGPALSHVTDGTNATLVAQPMIYDATRFRLIGPTGGTLTATTVNAMGSAFFPFSTFGLSFNIRFQFTAA